MTEPNSDNSVAAIFVNSTSSSHGCIAANLPYPGGEPNEVSYTIKGVLDNHKYKLTVCQVVHGSMGSYCDNIVIRFLSRNYVKQGNTEKVLSVEKLGEW